MDTACTPSRTVSAATSLAAQDATLEHNFGLFSIPTTSADVIAMKATPVTAKSPSGRCEMVLHLCGIRTSILVELRIIIFHDLVRYFYQKLVPLYLNYVAACHSTGTAFWCNLPPIRMIYHKVKSVKLSLKVVKGISFSTLTKGFSNSEPPGGHPENTGL
jgi:hypothetical protein